VHVCACVRVCMCGRVRLNVCMRERKRETDRERETEREVTKERDEERNKERKRGRERVLPESWTFCVCGAHACVRHAMCMCMRDSARVRICISGCVHMCV